MKLFFQSFDKNWKFQISQRFIQQRKYFVVEVFCSENEKMLWKISKMGYVPAYLGISFYEHAAYNSN